MISAVVTTLCFPSPAAAQDRLPLADDPGVIRIGDPYGYIPPTGGDQDVPDPVSYTTSVRGGCGDAALNLEVQQVETGPAAGTLKVTVTRFSVRVGDEVVTTDPAVLRSLRGYSVVAARPECEWPVLELEMILSSHDKEPELVRRVLQFKDGEVSYFFQEPLDSMERVRWAVPR